MSVCVAYPTNVGALNFCWKTALKSLAKKLPRLQASKLQEVLQHEDNGGYALVNLLGSLILDRDATVPIASCFRPIMLHLTLYVVQEHIVSGSSRHEDTVVMFAKVLRMCPQVSRVALQYIREIAPPLEALISQHSLDFELAHALLTLYHLLPQARQTWKWEPLLDLLVHKDDGMKWIGLESADLLFQLSDAEKQALVCRVMDENRYLHCIYQDECKQRITKCLELETWHIDHLQHGNSASLIGLEVPNGYVELCGVYLPDRHKENPVASRSTKQFVVTPRVQHTIASTCLALSLGWPLLLEGPPGCGKSSLIQYLATLTGNAANMICIHLDEEMDSKSLFGAYVCTETPGEFVWQPGPLIEAMTAGRWFLVEDINLAPQDVLAALLPLLETGQLQIPQRAEVIVAEDGFQFISSVTAAPASTGAGAYTASSSIEDIFGGLLVRIDVDAPPTEEIRIILAERFQDLDYMLEFAVSMLMLMRRACGQANASEQGYNAQEILASFQAGGLLSGPSQSAPEFIRLGRHLSCRDLVKWCHRMQDIHGPLVRRSSTAAQSCSEASVAKLPLALREAAFVEAADIFVAMLSNDEAAMKLLRSLAMIWGVPFTAVDQYASLSKPGLAVHRKHVELGRASLPVTGMYAPSDSLAAEAAGQSSTTKTGLFSYTSNAMRMLERIAVSLQLNEPLLLVGETGTGKTTMVQQLAAMTGTKLVVLNLSQQTDSSDLLGGFRPIQAQHSMIPLLEKFHGLFAQTWPRGDNQEFLHRVNKYGSKRQWKLLMKAFRVALVKVGHLTSNPSHDKPLKRRRTLDPATVDGWAAFADALETAEKTTTAAQSGFAFAFVEGALVRALRDGHWLLLDEMNLAPPEALERIAALLEDRGSSLTLAERGDVTALPRHPDFRLLAAMNPATDAGKHDLPAGVRNRFTEVYTPELSAREDLLMLVNGYLAGVGSSAPPTDWIVAFYIDVRRLVHESLQDGAGQKPNFNLRTLCRALEYVRKTAPVYGMTRALHDGLSMSFSTMLDDKSASIVQHLLLRHIPGLQTKTSINAPPLAPGSGKHVLFDEFWLEAGPEPIPESREDDGSGRIFVESPSIRKYLRNLARALLLRKYPILLQGPTSSGKTSLVSYLAAQTGHRFVRINNHDQTDLQEYFGSYVANAQGQLMFQEGILVQAARNGWWVVLDELNLAPTEVLEALNRLLDDNRELHVPDLQETITPHPHFMLFATQNPPGLYSGRKQLSRAFRSRFLELQVDQVPDRELATIIERRCGVAPSHAAALVAVQHELILRRSAQNFLAGKHGFITPRDLLRWAERGGVGYQDLAENGFLILGERLRDPQERAVVIEVLHRCLRGAKLDMKSLYLKDGDAPVERLKTSLTSMSEVGVADMSVVNESLSGIVWTDSMRRMYTLVERCWRHAEPVMLVGQTGCGKTTVCQMVAAMRGQRLHIINCNQHTEASDFLGGFRPVRDRQRCATRAVATVAAMKSLQLWAAQVDATMVEAHEDLTPDQLYSVATTAARCADAILSNISPEHHSEALKLKELSDELHSAIKELRAPFVWVDGPLVEAMRRGDCILIDEINLADDAVLERLNSVLESGRTLTLAEKGGEGAEVVTAAKNFRISATMNPGGDYGKKELSPALSNRFTSVWVPGIEDDTELKAILDRHLANPELRSQCSMRIMEFWRQFQSQVGSKAILSPRDLLSWVKFINCTSSSLGILEAYAHGAYLTLIDGIGLGTGLSPKEAQNIKIACHNALLAQLPDEKTRLAADDASGFKPQDHDRASGGNRVSGSPPSPSIRSPPGHWGIAPFFIPCGPNEQDSSGNCFDMRSPTTARNVMRVLRALQLRKPVLLEGSPGVGKTSLVAALAAASGHKLVRINLSEQTDIMDLLGADLPSEEGEAGDFRWADGPLLMAIKAGDWVLLDELNLAGQSVLEGLNALLDHRSQIYIPELGTSFTCPASFRLFAAQNPLQEGGGRKGLPRSFLNRFSRVHVELLEGEDLEFIASTLHPTIEPDLVKIMVEFLTELGNSAGGPVSRGDLPFAVSGGPWEFNLRDLLRWCQLVESTKNSVQPLSSKPVIDHVSTKDAIEHFLHVLFVHRLRTWEDRQKVVEIWQYASGSLLQGVTAGGFAQDYVKGVQLTPQYLRVGRAFLVRGKAGRNDSQPARPSFLHTNDFSTSGSSNVPLQLLAEQLPYLESVCHATSVGAMAILVGPPSVGKTSLVRALARLAGQNLCELTLTSTSDTSDLLGGFEQVDTTRKLKELTATAQDLGSAACKSILCRTPTDEMDGIPIGSSPQTSMALEFVKSVHTSQSKRAAVASTQQKTESILKGILELASLLVSVSSCQVLGGSSTSWLASEAYALQEQAQKLLEDKTTQSGRFEWVDGALLRAIENGDWVLLENANMCNPTVLDRLNPLLEPGGKLYLNECGSAGGNVRVILPHPRFRLFLALDPRHGDVSRAMRNRGIELCILPTRQGQLASLESDAAEHPQQSVEACQVSPSSWALLQENIPAKLVPYLSDAHTFCVAEAQKSRTKVPGLRELRYAARLSNRLVQQGWDADRAVSCAWRIAYHRGRLDGHVPRIDYTSAQAREGEAIGEVFRSLWSPCQWPTLIDTWRMSKMSTPWQVLRDAAVFESFSLHLVMGSLITSGESLQVPDIGSGSANAMWYLAHSLHAFANFHGVKGALTLSRSRREKLFMAAECFANRATADDWHLRAMWVAMFMAWLIEVGKHETDKGNAMSGVVETILTSCKVAQDILKHSSTSSEFEHHKRYHGIQHVKGMLTLGNDYNAEFLPPRAHPQSTGGLQSCGLLCPKGRHILVGDAVRWAALRAAEERKVDAMVLIGNATVAQMSMWRFKNPRARARAPAGHPALDLLHPLFLALVDLEQSMLTSDLLGHEDLALLDRVQQWRSFAWQLTDCGALSSTDSMTSYVGLDSLAYAWVKLRKSLHLCRQVTSCPASLQPNGRMSAVMRELDDAFGLVDGLAAKPWAWKGAGHKQQPPTKKLVVLEENLRRLCDVSQLGPHAESPNSAIWEACRFTGTELHGDLAQCKGLMQATAASLASDAQFRTAAMKALSLVTCGAITSPSPQIVDLLEGGASEMQKTLEVKVTKTLQALQATFEAGDGVQHSLLGGLVQDNLALLDEPLVAVGGCPMLPLLLPEQHMQSEKGRKMQTHLAALLDCVCLPGMVHLMSRIAECMATGCPHVGSVSLPAEDNLKHDLAVALDVSVYNGVQSPADFTAIQNLLWLLQSLPSSSSTEAKELMQFIPNALHELFYTWHKIMRSGSASDGLATYKGCTAAVPFQARIAFRVSDLLASSNITVAERSVRLLQLKLALRILKRYCPPSPGQSHGDLCDTPEAADVYVAASQLVNLLVAMQGSLPTGTLQGGFNLACNVLLDQCRARLAGPQQAHTLQEAGCVHSQVMDAIDTCTHPWMKKARGIASRLVDAALCAAEGSHDMLARGRLWALLGSFRLLLVQPPPGVDPASKHQSKRVAINMCLKYQVEPRIALHNEMQTLPGGPSESEALAALKLRREALLNNHEALARKCVPRPDQSQYADVQEEFSHLLKGLACPDKLADLVEKLQSSSSAALMQEVITWQDSVLTWCDKMKRSYPFYLDVLQPVFLALSESCYGLDQLLAASQSQSGYLSPKDAKKMETVISSLMGFPPTLPTSTKASQAMRALPLSSACSSSNVLMLEHISAAAIGGNADQHSHQKCGAKQVASFSARISALRVALNFTALDAISSRSETAVDEFSSVLQQLLTVWEDIKAAQEAAAAEEDQLFRNKQTVTTTEGVDEDEELEASYHQQFPSYSSLFDDLDKTTMEIDDTAQVDLPSTETTQAQAQSSAAKTLLSGELLNEIVWLHRQVFSAANTSPCMPSPRGDVSLSRVWVGAWHRGYQFGAQVLHQLKTLGVMLSADVDRCAAGGHLMAVALERLNLACELRHGSHKVVATQTSSVLNDERKSPYLNMQEPCVEETALVQAPLRKLMERLRVLLDEWPDHPILAQLAAICSRVLNFPLSSPVKAVLTGLELVLSRAQVWEDSAAAHVSLAENLGQVAALAQRWRKLELESWRRMLTIAEENHAACAHASWFHLFRILLGSGGLHGNGTEVVLEQFLQTSTVGEFARRLAMLETFQWHLERRAQTHQHAWNRSLATTVANLRSYYNQFQSAVDSHVEACRAPMENEIADFVKLSKWEDRGYYSLKESADRAQRKLHKICRRFTALLQQPVARIINSSATKISTELPSLQLQEKLAVLAVTEGTKGLLNSNDWSCFVLACCEAAAAPLPVLGEPEKNYVFEIHASMSTCYQLHIPSLITRMGGIISDVMQLEQVGSPPVGCQDVDQLAGTIAGRASELRGISGKGSRSLKKKALTDMLRALLDLGLSRHRSAVPPEERSVSAWFKVPIPGVGATAAEGRSMANWPAGAIKQDAMGFVESQWNVANSYYFRSIASIQQLWRAASSPSGDLSSGEVQASQRFSEHIMYLQQLQRRVVHSAWEVEDALVRTSNLLASLAPTGGSCIPQQKATLDAAAEQKCRLDGLTLTLAAMISLSAAVAQGETSAEARQSAVVHETELRKAAACCGQCKEALDNLLDDAKLPTRGIRNSEGVSQVATPELGAVLASNSLVLRKVQIDISSFISDGANANSQLRIPRTALKEPLPGWKNLCDALSEAAAVVSVVASPLDQAAEIQAMESFTLAVEALVKASLVWVQNLKAREASGSNILEWSSALQARLCLGDADAVIKHAAFVMAFAGRVADVCAKGSPNLQFVQATLRRVKPIIDFKRTVLAEATSQYISFHKAVCKLGLVITSVLANLMADGFCSVNEEGECEGDGDGDGNFQGAEGTGLGEGEGTRDVSDQIENQDQVLGAKQEQDQEKEEDAGKPIDKDGKTTGIEMDDDFDGEMNELSDDEEAANSSGEDNDGAVDNLDEEMGDVDNGDMVDKRLWEDGDEKEQEQAGKNDDGQAAKVADKSNLDYEAGEHEENDCSKDKDGARRPDAGEPDEGNNQTEDGEVNALEYEDQNLGVTEPEEEFKLPENLSIENEDGQQEDEELSGSDAGEHDNHDAEKHDHDQGPGPNADDDDDKGAQAEDAGMGEAEPGGEEPEVDEDGPDTAMEDNQVPQNAMPGTNEGDGPDELEDPQHAGVGDGEEQQTDYHDAAPEVGPEGMPNNATLSEEVLGSGSGGHDSFGDQEEKANTGEKAPDQNDEPNASQRQGQSRNASAGVAEAGTKGAAQHRGEGDNPNPQVSSQLPSEPNPFRSLGSALEHWKAKLAVTSEATAEDGAGAETPEEDGQDAGAPEYEFLNQDTPHRPGDTQALASATEEQASKLDIDESHLAATGEDQEQEESQRTNMDGNDLPKDHTMIGHSPNSWRGKNPSQQDSRKDEQGSEDQEAACQEQAATDAAEDISLHGVPGAANSYASVAKQQAGQEGVFDGSEKPASRDQLLEIEDALRAELDALLHQDAQHRTLDAEQTNYGQLVWQRCEALTLGLAAELTEQLRIILEPSLASRLAGEYRTGKRINMKKVIAYIASNFRRDKIWLRRTRPDKRCYQVIVAIDDSKSMTENSCGAFALEALALICQAMSRVEVGELGILSFGGGSVVSPLHSLECPFSSAAGPAVMSALRFDRDNTIADQPMGNLLVCLEHMLEGARTRIMSQSHIGTRPVLQQLVLILADGHFHEKDAILKRSRELCSRPGVLVAFIALDSSTNSLLDMKSVKFVDGKPVLSQYMDSFPFPFHIVLRDLAALPQTLANLLRQWFQACS